MNKSIFALAASAAVLSSCAAPPTDTAETAAVTTGQSTSVTTAESTTEITADTESETMISETTADTHTDVLPESPYIKLSEDTVKFYRYWKDKYLKQDPYSQDETRYYVYYSEESYSQGGEPVAITVSEAHGYGMLIAASMYRYDSEAKDIFDGLYRYYKAHPSSIGPNLMSWQQSDNGSALIDSEGSDSATDGDLDIAYALLMADEVWGSDGEIDYRKAAVDVINDIMEYEVSREDNILRLGDWTYGIEKGNVYYSATRSSDFIMQYMPVFAKAADDDRWLTVYETTYGIIRDTTEEYKTGILPDFYVKDEETGKFVPAPPDLLESENDGNYYYNACRTPWRIGMDGIINKNKDSIAFSKTIDAFISTKTGGDPWQIMAGYTPGGDVVSDWNDLCFDSPFMITAAAAGNTEWHDSIREMVLGYGEDVYFGDTITMLCLIIDDGAWIVPAL